MLAIYQTAISLGLALGSALWGAIAHPLGVGPTMMIAGGLFLAISILWLRPRARAAE